MEKRAVFLDRDGVLIKDANLLTEESQIEVLCGVPEALALLKKNGFYLVVVSNQTVVSRGLISEKEVERLETIVENNIESAGGARPDAFFFCPHHPQATLKQYRIVCNCRKPEPGLIHQAAKLFSLSLQQSFMVGDRITDVLAGRAAGCRSVLLITGMHSAPPIVTVKPIDESVKPDRVFNNLLDAASWMVEQP